MFRITIVLVLLACVAACRHPLEVVGQGDIVSSSGTRDCSVDVQPCNNLVTGAYYETYTAIPRPGWRFTGWEGCGDQFPECAFTVDADIVANFDGQVMPALKAVFEPITQDKPNILVIMVDDMGYNDLAINNGNTAIHTPNMDQLARDGVRFTRHYAAPSCSPARAAFLSGMVPARVGFLPNGAGISPQLTTLPERLQQEGYTTWHIGKWHVGDLYAQAQPDQQGFDHWFGFLNQSRLAGDMVDGEIQLAAGRYEDPYLEGSGIAGQHYPGHLENILTDKAEQVLTELDSATDPWYLNLWFFAPHKPISPAPEFAAGYPDTADGRYRALIHQLDYNIGRVVDHLAVLGALENTIVVVVSDNGGAANVTENNDNNAPYAGFKSWLFEGSLRTPLIVRWPERSLAGTIHSGVVSIEDIYPSLLEAVGGGPVADIDGQSFVSAIQGQQPSTPRPLYWEHALTYNSFSLLSGDRRWKYYQIPPLWGQEVGPLLYDLELDPTASESLVAPPQQVLDSLYADYAAWYRQVHVVPTDYAASTNGAGHLSGDDLQRTPGQGGFTFGVGIAHDYYGNIASQQGTWQINREINTVQASFGSLNLSGDITPGQSCHSVVVSGSFYRRTLFFTKDRTLVSLFIDGVAVDSLDVEQAIPISDISAPTIVGDDSQAGNGVIYDPVILNRGLETDTVWPIAEFSASLCPQA